MQLKRRKWDNLQTVALVSSYVPRRCGIATFCRDLAEALGAYTKEVRTTAVALNDRPEGYRYPDRVWFEINEKRHAEYRLAADFLNMSAVDVVCLQHEFGIFGGEDGGYVLDLIKRLRMPVVATLHTVLKDPLDGQRAVMQQMAELCDRFIVMAERAKDFLHDIYHIPESKVTLIPHGIPDVPFADPNYHKDQFGVEGKKTIMTFGLIGPSKGLENMIEAMPQIVKKHPDAVYMIVGATHPGVIAHQGEEYRLGLQRRTRELGVEQNVRWINKFLDLEELVEYLGAADVYVTPYLNEAQITSGTLAYAMGTGKATVSTPYWHAQELLADGRGVLTGFRDTNALAAAITDLFDHDVKRHAMRKAAYTYTRSMVWRDVAGQYMELFKTVREERNQNPRPASLVRQLSSTRSELPEIKLDHVTRLTDSCGIFQRAKSTIPVRAGGYTTDDNARALIASLIAQDHVDYQTNVDLETLVGVYLAFLEHAFDDEAGRFRHKLGYDHVWDPAVDSEEAHARAVWALGEAVARCQTRGPMTLAANLFNRALPACEELQHARSCAYALIGIHAYLRRFSGDSHARRVREHMAHWLFDRIQQHAAPDWPWYTDRLTYGCSRVPHALLLSGRWMFNNEMIQVALRSLEWLHGVQSGDNDHFTPIGNNGWFPRDGQKARFDQQPIEANAMIDACLEAYRVTADGKWVDRAHRCLNWFLGANDLHQPLYDHSTGGCAEALMAHGVSENQSAEPTLAWLLSLLALYDHHLDESSPAVSEKKAAPPASPQRTAPEPAAK